MRSPIVYVPGWKSTYQVWPHVIVSQTFVPARSTKRRWMGHSTYVQGRRTLASANNTHNNNQTSCIFVEKNLRRTKNTKYNTHKLGFLAPQIKQRYGSVHLQKCVSLYTQKVVFWSFHFFFTMSKINHVQEISFFLPMSKIKDTTPPLMSKIKDTTPPLNSLARFTISNLFSTFQALESNNLFIKIRGPNAHAYREYEY